MEPFKLVRQSISGVECQFEYIPARKVGEASEYRVRHGNNGTYTRWFRTPNIFGMINTLGFNASPVTSMHDFAFESHFGRALLPLNRKMVTYLSNTAGKNPTSAKLFAQVKNLGEDKWALPSVAVAKPDVYAYMAKIAQRYI